MLFPCYVFAFLLLFSFLVIVLRVVLVFACGMCVVFERGEVVSLGGIRHGIELSIRGEGYPGVKGAKVA